MKTFAELTTAALAARKNNVSRADFLAALDPDERSDGAMQFDRSARLDAHNSNPASEEAISTEARRIAVQRRLVNYFDENPSAYGADLLIRMLSGRIMSAGMERAAAAARVYAEMVTDEEIAAARQQAIQNINTDRDYLAARLGVAVR